VIASRKGPGPIGLTLPPDGALQAEIEAILASACLPRDMLAACEGYRAAPACVALG
jgi:hypothetical protein